ncbi:nuclear transport factor 2 family protein [Actinoplanes sp. M2I2]|uniref:nuclear transport factor 2 family protein n=1 Tax=Actinoplanes sp. M2I2 TaxID=1734444 RepID=UPI0020209F4F|nr:nuclear transport factor 2 family protein [Actinoplanes sp. M2I2]
MSETPLALDRYLTLIDPAIAGEVTLDEFVDVFAPDAVAQIGGPPAQGADAVRELYRQFFAAHVEAKHFWNTTVLPDGRQRAEWVAAARTADGSVITVAGVEHATVGEDGRIVELHNEFTRPPA